VSISISDSGDYVSFVISTNEQGAYEAGQVLVKELDAKGWRVPTS
jgi:ABC-type sugar transport system substrate-binding protein